VYYRIYQKRIETDVMKNRRRRPVQPTRGAILNCRVKRPKECWERADFETRPAIITERAMAELQALTATMAEKKNPPPAPTRKGTGLTVPPS
jgi:hypothetical protein